MKNFLALIVLIACLGSCSTQSFLEESQLVASLPLSAAYDATDEGILLEWSANWDNTEFVVLRGRSEGTMVSFVSNVLLKYWMDIEAVPGVDFFYKVLAYNRSGRLVGETAVVKGFRSYQNYAEMDAPIEFKADEGKYGDRINLYWFGQVRSFFRIYRSKGTPNNFSLIAETSGVKYTDTNVSPGEVYYYQIASVGKDLNVNKVKERFYNAVDTVGAEASSLASFVKGSTADVPVGIEATDASSSVALSGAIHVSWTWDSNAEYYRIYRLSESTGEFELVAPYVRAISNVQTSDGSSILKGIYIDRGLPSLEGKPALDGKFVYPTYSYKVSVVKNGQESSLSAEAKGSAVNPKDVLPAPENVKAEIKKSAVSGFDPTTEFPVLDAGKYKLIISWDVLPADIQDSYRFLVFASNTVTGVENNLTPSGLDKTVTFIEIDNPAFNDEYRYIVRAMNQSKGDLLGQEGRFLYKNVTPLPPTFVSASLLKRLELTNEVATNAQTYTHYSARKVWGEDNFDYTTGSVSKIWKTTAQVGDVDLTFVPNAPNTQQSYNIYRRRKGSGDNFLVVTNVSQTNDPDNPSVILTQLIQDTNFTPDQYRGTAGAGSLSEFYPLYEYRITSVNNGVVSALTELTKEGQAINPADILPAPEYLSVPFHFASGTGLAFWYAKGWIVRDREPRTTGIDQIVNQSGPGTETQRIFVTWASITASVAFNYRFRHSKAGRDYTDPSQWHDWTAQGSPLGRATWVKMNNETTTDWMTGLYGILDSVKYEPHSAAFAVSAVNENTAGLDGNTIGILFEEPPTSPY